MGAYDKFDVPRVNPSGFVFGQEFNDAMAAFKDVMRFMSNMGAYVVHPDMRAGAFPTIAAALAQASEVPVGSPVIVALCPGVEYNENVVVDQKLFEDHDLHFINSFEDYTDQKTGMSWTGSLTLPEIHPWAARNKMLNMFGVNLKDFTLNLNSGWDTNMRRLRMENILCERWHQAVGCRLWVHDCVQQGSLRVRDRDDGIGQSQVILSHCALSLNDNPQSFDMTGAYDMLFVQCYINAWLNQNGGIFDMRPPLGAAYSGTLHVVDTTFLLAIGADDTGFAKDCGNASVRYEGQSVFQVVSGNPKSFNLGAFAKAEGMPYCRLKGVMPTNAPNGTKASDDTVDYRDKTWSGAAWV